MFTEATDASKKYTITLDDDPLVHKIISRITGINSLPFSCPEKLIARAGSFQPMAVFVDIHLGIGVSGLDFIKEMRAQWQYVPIIVVTTDQSVDSIGEALAVGANDFVRKPFVPEEFLARLMARTAEMQARFKADVLTIADCRFDTVRGSLSKDDQTVYLPKMEANLLLYLASNMGIVVDKKMIKRKFWGKLSVSENALDKKISNLRLALKQIDAGCTIKTVYGSGVCLSTTQSKRNNLSEK